MAEPRRFLDVWIIESNTVYREVPFAVVTDWVQQSRLLPDDRVRPSGTAEWFHIGGMPAFVAYLPKVEPFRAEDEAEALEPVQLDIAWKRRRGDEDDDVDMIPLIDISLVLLIFFMMTATVGAGVNALIHTPTVEYKHLLVNPEMVWIGIKDSGKGPVYAIGKGESGSEDLVSNLSEADVLQRLNDKIKGQLVDVRIAADSELPYEVVKKLTVELERRRPKNITATAGVRKIYAEVSEKEGQ
jgi:biopolymer transport protein ExbD